MDVMKNILREMCNNGEQRRLRNCNRLHILSCRIRRDGGTETAYLLRSLAKGRRNNGGGYVFGL